MDLFNKIPRDVFYYFLEHYLTIPGNDPDIVALTALWKSKKGKKWKSSKSCTIINTNMHFGLHPITATHRWLRVLARTCKYMRNSIYAYRKELALKIAEKYHSNLLDKYYKIETWKLNFLYIEKRMTKQRSKHMKCVKNSKNPRTTQKYEEKVQKFETAYDKMMVSNSLLSELTLSEIEHNIQEEVNAEYDRYEELIDRMHRK